jgi:SNF2 family DNA or RNA helicase/ubiquinone/menaquinone biosynthesis C-methylase UbiE
MGLENFIVKPEETHTISDTESPQVVFELTHDVSPIQAQEIASENIGVDDPPLVDKKTGVYVDSEGQAWATNTRLTKIFGCDRDTLSKRLGTVRTQKGRMINIPEVNLYNLTESQEIITSYQNLPQVDKETGAYIDENGDRWVPQRHFRNLSGMGSSTFVKYIDGVSAITGRSKGGHVVTLYKESEVNYRLSGLLNLPQVDKETKRYINATGESYISASVFSRENHIASSTLDQYLADVRGISGRDSMNHQITLYSESELRKILGPLLNRQFVHKEKAEHIDEDGNTWMTAKKAASKIGVAGSTISQYLDKVASISVRGSRRELKLYNLDELRELTKDFLDLPEVNKESGLYTDSEGMEWATVAYFADQYGVSYSMMKNIFDRVNSIPGRDRMGKTTNLLRVDEVRQQLEEFTLLPQVNADTGFYLDSESQTWVTPTFLKQEFGLDRKTIYSLTSNIPNQPGRTQNNIRTVLINHAEAERVISQYLSLPVVDKETGKYIDNDGISWVPTGVISRNPRGIITGNEDIRSKMGRDRMGRVTTLFNEEDARKALREHELDLQLLAEDRYRRKLQKPKIEKKDWSKLQTIEDWVEEFFRHPEWIGNSTSQIQKENVDGRHFYNAFRKWATTNSSTDQERRKLVEQIFPARYTSWSHLKTLEDWRVELAKHPEWIGRTGTQMKGDTESGANSFFQGYRKWINRSAQTTEERLSLLQELFSPKLYSWSNLTTIDEWRSEYQSHPEWSNKSWTDMNKDSESGAKQFRRAFEKWLAKIPDKHERRELLQQLLPEIIQVNEQSLSKHAADIKEGKSLDAKRFRSLLNLFGGSKAVDILFRTRPEYRRLPVDNVKSTLAEYLGDFLVTKAPFSLEDLGNSVPLLSETSFRDGLVEVIKEQCLDYYNSQRRDSTGRPTYEIISEYLTNLEAKIGQIGSEGLTEVGIQTRAYYESLLNDFIRPPQFVGSLKEGRLFPDINQLINIKELAEKKKILIADEMGLGKSASAILAKEMLGISQALIVVPSNVISTWQKYLSDQPGGYFRKGQAPRILVVESLDTLQGKDISAYEYVVVSHEKLTDNYMQDLQQLNFDMLIVDEVHKMKNINEGTWSRNLLTLAQKIEGEDKYLALLSGTPVPNKIQDLALILKLLYPDQFKSMSNKQLVHNIIKGDLIDLRSLLLPRMQMKSLTESIEMPSLEEIINNDVQLSVLEQQVYEVLLEEDEIEVTEKIKILRQFLLNPSLLETTPDLPSAKIEMLGNRLTKAFESKDKVIVFINGYVEGVIRGENTIFDKLVLPEGVTIRVIDGSVPKKERERIQAQLESGTGKILFVVSGQTADVGVDFSAGESVFFYNEPWTQFDKDQQLGRVYREGLKNDLASETFIVPGTIEEGIHDYIRAKYTAINKLLHGIPITQLEKELLEKSEQQTEPNLEVNPELAAYYFSSWDKMMKIFSYVREIGEVDFLKFLEDYGKDYAQGYEDMGRRSYQANASRISATIIDNLILKEFGREHNLTILDLASGPEMLRRHSPELYGDSIASLDINPHHFLDKEGGKRFIGSFTNLPFADNSADYVNLSLAWHYSKFSPKHKDYERLQVLTEANRVLKPGGKVVINNIYSLTIKNNEMFRNILDLIGFKIVEEFTGEINVGNNYKSNVITLEKIHNIDTDAQTIIETIGQENFGGLKFVKTKSSLRDSRRVIKEFILNDRTYPISLNSEDLVVLDEEESIINEGQELKERFGSIQNIPAREILDRGYVRILIGNNYILFKKLDKSSGVVTIK